MGIRGIEPRLAAHKTAVLTATLYARMRHPGIEPGPLAWKASILTTGLMALDIESGYLFKLSYREYLLVPRPPFLDRP